MTKSWFDHIILFFIGLNCITLAMERPLIPPDSIERAFLSFSNYVFTFVFAVEMLLKVIAVGMFYGTEAYFTSGWNIMDGLLVTVSIVDILMSLLSSGSPRIFGILRVIKLFVLFFELKANHPTTLLILWEPGFPVTTIPTATASH